MAKTLMIQGTMSNAGKSLITAGLLRIMKQDGFKAAPFKSQNMALNSYITEEGLEMGRAQAVQAEAAGTEPSADMNPILLKPTTDVGSQVIVHGIHVGNMEARQYFAYKKTLIPEILASFDRLKEQSDIKQYTSLPHFFKALLLIPAFPILVSVTTGMPFLKASRPRATASGENIRLSA